VTIAIRPSGGVGWREFVEMICPSGEAKYFCKGGLDRRIENAPDGQITHGSDDPSRFILQAAFPDLA
jgi:hypothetical protein